MRTTAPRNLKFRVGEALNSKGGRLEARNFIKNWAKAL